MPSKHGNFIKETTVTEGAGDLILANIAGFSRFSDELSVDDLTEYSVKNGNNWETGLGTVRAGNGLGRTTPIATLVNGIYNDSSPAPIALLGSSIVGGVNTAQNIDLATFGMENVKNVRHGAVGDGFNDDRDAFASADAIGNFVIPSSIYSIQSDLTITNDITPVPGAILKPANGVTITINGAIDAGLWQIFDTSAGGSFAGVSRTFPEWFGALSGADDTVAIQSMYDSGAIDATYSPKTYTITAEITAATGCVTDFNGATIKVGAGVSATIDNMFSVTTATGVEFLNGTIDGNIANHAQSVVVGIRIENGTDNEVTKCVIKNITTQGLRYTNVQQSKIMWNRITNTGVQGILASSGAAAGNKLQDIEIAHNTVWLIDDGATNSRGIQVQGDATNLEQDAYAIDIHNNICHDNTRWGIYCLWMKDSSVTDNICYSNGNSAGADGDGILCSAGCSDNNVVGNNCYDNYHGIRIDTKDSASAVYHHFNIEGNFCNSNGNMGIRNASSSDVQITGNHCNFNDSVGIQTGGQTTGTITYDPETGDWAEGCNVLIEGNTCTLNKAKGISVSGTNDGIEDISVLTNKVTYNGTNKAATNGGIVFNTVNNSVIKGNHSISNYNSTIKRGDYLIDVDAIDNIVMTGNYGRVYLVGTLSSVNTAGLRVTSHQWPNGQFFNDETSIDNNLWVYTADNFTIETLGLDSVIVTANGGAFTSDTTTAIANGYKGQKCVLYNRSATNDLTLKDSANTNWSTGADIVLTASTCMEIFFNGTDWIDV